MSLPPESALKEVALPLSVQRHGEHWRAGYAADARRSRGRLHGEPGSPLRSAFQRDRDRVIHSNAFRRLKHKTQVFIHHEGDHFRTRLTHTLEVAQIARSLARPLGLDEDLAEALALAHDLGHPPFGHAGERALDLALTGHGGFDHNAQSLRVVTLLERRYPTFDGLNLTWETLEGLAKHNGPVSGALPFAVAAFGHADALRLDLFASLEAQVAALADDIAYDAHDIDDGVRAGLLSLDELSAAPVAGPILAAIAAEFPQLEPSRTVHELVRRVITLMITDVLRETAGRITGNHVVAAEDVVAFGAPLVGFSPGLEEEEKGLKAFLSANLYRHPDVMRPVGEAERVVERLFDELLRHPEQLPEDWRTGRPSEMPTELARRVADYIAGMTDRYALAEYRRLFDDAPDLS